MKKTTYLLAAVFGGLLISCSSDDSNDQGSDFSIPLSTGKYWTYDVKVDGEDGSTRDSLYIAGDIVISGNSYKEFKTKDDLATGFYSSSLRNNGVREADDKLLLTGELSLADGEELPIGLDLSLSDFIIFKKNATPDELLSTKSGSFQQDFNGFPLTITYSLKSKGGEALPSFTTSEDDTYSNVKTTKIVLNVSITTTYEGIPIPITVLPAQDVLTSVQYLADGIGVVYTETVTTYTVPEAVATELGIPQTNTQTQKEFLDTHN